VTVKLGDTIRELIDGPHAAGLATPNADGRPQSSVIFVKYEDDDVVFSTIKGRLKTRKYVPRSAGQPAGAEPDERPLRRGPWAGGD
jgi:hypothetical protein